MKNCNFERYAYMTVSFLGLGILLFLFFKYIFLSVLPFLLSWTCVFFLSPLADKISKKIHINKKVISVVLTVALLFLGIAVIVAVVFFAVKEAWEFFTRVAADEKIISVLAWIGEPFGTLFGDMEGAEALRDHLSGAIRDGIGKLTEGLVSILSKIASSIPRVIFFLLVTVISSVYFAIDVDRINSFIKKLLPKKAVIWAGKVKNSSLTVVAKYLRSYLIIMSITFCVMLLGLSIVRVKNSIFIAFILAVLDLLPLIGVGTVIVPWSIFEIVVGNTALGVGLIILLCINEVIRQLAEPKIIGKNLGVHPIVSLILLYVGYSVLGFIGLLLVPVLAVILNLFFSKNNTTQIP